MITNDDIKALVTYFDSLSSVPTGLEVIVEKLECMDDINDKDARIRELMINPTPTPTPSPTPTPTPTLTP